ncbi:PEPxxWA-CTERM sorting domain-containing protein [Sphingomonas flavescens]|uniref:PEPxxWA-CTERM sorting domain-containing protein n=1 Tax=Sphingomonas flavescens TaxID=3132797 RepID=UPI002805F361|nr:PEPxxWA-CTERM sorting domain-containing protein [Sphingomonas limnosediminicola]
MQGTLDGTVSVTGTPISNLLFNYLITSGTGQFLGATGSFIGTGTADLSRGPPATITLNFRAVPEPATWAMMLLGFAGIGLTIRRRQAPALRPA